MRAAITLALALASVAPASSGPATSGPPPSGPPLSGQALDARTESVASLLRCPVCQGLSVADSPATMARNMKAEVREKLAAGYQQEEILAGFERSYGEFVRLEPTLHGVNWLVWAGPIAGLLIGALVVGAVLRRTGRAPAAAEELPSRHTLPDDPRLAVAVLRVRELAYGWPGGIEGGPGARGGESGGPAGSRS